MERKPGRELTPRQLRAIERELRNQAQGRCQNCGIEHGHMIEQPDGSIFRFETGLFHLDGHHGNNRRVNLRIWCQVCRGDSPHPLPGAEYDPTHPGGHHAQP